MPAPQESICHRSIPEALWWRAEHQADDEAITFLVDGETREVSLTYSELDRWARGIGAQLQGVGRETPLHRGSDYNDAGAARWTYYGPENSGERALILCPAGLEYSAAFFGCICSGWVAVPLYTPTPADHIESIRGITQSALPRAAITTRSMMPAFDALYGEIPELAGLHWIIADEVPTGSENRWQRPEIELESVALLVYTSGSTSTPKGIARLHRNFVVDRDERYYGSMDRHRRLVNWLPPHSVVGVLFGNSIPMAAGMPTTHMAPEAFLERPARWVEVMSRTRATHTFGANFAYELLIKAVPPEERARLDLGNWEFAFNSGEQVRAETVERFETTFAASGLRRGATHSMYGITETAGVSSSLPGAGLTVARFDRSELEEGRVVPVPEGSEPQGLCRTLVGLGPSYETDVVIVDPQTRTRRATGEVGEIWVAGIHVTGGYWNAPEATRDAFECYLADTERGPYFHTGDLGFIHEGEIFITGRVKDVIIIRGRNSQATDVELVAQRSHPALESQVGAAFAVETGDEERLIVVQELSGTDDLPRIATAVRRAVLAGIGIEPYAVVLAPVGAVPRTANGKIRRAACREAYLDGVLPALFTGTRSSEEIERRVPYAPPTTQIERDLAAIWEGVLGVQPIGIHDKFLDFGGDSLRSLQVLAAMRAHGIHVSMEALHTAGTIAALAPMTSTQPTAPDEAPVVGPVPLLLMQYGVLANREEVPRNVAAPLSIAATEPLDPEVLERAARHLVFHHDVLRMRFRFTDYGWEAECIAHTPGHIVTYHDLSSLSPDRQLVHMHEEEERTRGLIDIRRGVMLQIALFHRGGDEPDRTVFFMPHLVFDAYSFPILVADLETAYLQLREGKPVRLPAKTTTILRWGTRIREMIYNGEFRREIPYWLDVIQGAPSRLPQIAPVHAAGSGPIQIAQGGLDRGSTARLQHAVPARDGFRMVDALVWALARAAADQIGSSSILMDMWGHGREPLSPEMDLSRTVGYFTTQFPVRVELDPDAGPLEAAARTHRLLAKIPRHGIGFDALRYLCGEEICIGLRVPDRPIRLNYHGDVAHGYRGLTLFMDDEQSVREREAPPDGPGQPYTVASDAPPTELLDSAAFVVQGMLRLRVVYHASVYASKTMDDFVARTMEHLAELASLSAAGSHLAVPV